MEENYKPKNEKQLWGEEEIFTLNDVSSVKILTIAPGEATSLQKHQKRDEFWKVLEGNGWMTIGEERSEAKVGAEFFIKKETLHRAEGGNASLKILEISFGIFEKEDEVRLEDKYGRL